MNAETKKKSEVMMQEYSNMMAVLGDMLMAKDAMVSNMEAMDKQIDAIKIKARNLLVNIDHQQKKEMHHGSKESHEDESGNDKAETIPNQVSEPGLPADAASLAANSSSN